MLAHDLNNGLAVALSNMNYLQSAVSCGEGDLYVAGGVESMSRAPYVFSKADSPYSREVKMFDTTIGSRFPNPKVV